MGDLYSGIPRPAEYPIREFFGLPKTKQLVYYPKRHDTYFVPVERFGISGTYGDGYLTLTLLLDSGKEVNINPLYFATMQKPNFVELMRQSDKLTE